MIPCLTDCFHSYSEADKTTDGCNEFIDINIMCNIKQEFSAGHVINLTWCTNIKSNFAFGFRLVFPFCHLCCVSIH